MATWDEEIAEYEKRKKENYEKMIRQKRLNVGKISSTDESRPERQISNSKSLSSKKVSSSSLRDDIMALHRRSKHKPPIATQSSGKLSIFELKNLIANNKPNINTEKSNFINNSFNRYSLINNSIVKNCNYLIYTDQPLVIKFILTMKDTINWFIYNKFDYTIAEPNLEKLKNDIKAVVPHVKSNVENSLDKILEKSRSRATDSILQTLKLQKYQRLELRKSKPAPTHSIRKVKKIGKFLYVVKTKKIHTKEIKTVFLMCNDVHLKISKKDLIVLPAISHNFHIFPKEICPVFTNFHIYKKL